MPQVPAVGEPWSSQRIQCVSSERPSEFLNAACPRDCPALRLSSVRHGTFLGARAGPVGEAVADPPCTHQRLGSEGLQVALRRPREGPSLPAVFLLPSAGTPCGPSQGQLLRTDSGIVLALELENLLGRTVSIELLKGLSLPIGLFCISFGYEEGYKGRIVVRSFSLPPP